MDSPRTASVFASRQSKRNDLLDITKTSTADFLRGLDEWNVPHVSSKASTAVDSGMLYDLDAEIKVDDNEIRIVVAPPDIRANDVTFGMEEERVRLKASLARTPYTEQTTRGILIWSPGPGSGKTHLARDWFFANPNLYPEPDLYSGGSFWIDARSLGHITNSFWDIACTIGVYEAAPTMHNDPRRTTPLSLNGVKLWLQERSNWLMVFDGLNFDRDLTIEDFRALLPRGKGCSILFTSTDRGLESMLDDLIVSTVEVVPLSTADGVSLLAWAMDKPDPSHLLQAGGATIVESLKCQPLAICTFGRRAKIAQESKGRLQPGDSDHSFGRFYVEVIAFLQARQPQEVLYLVYLLAFFGQKIPFALVQLGAERLGISSVRIEAQGRDATHGTLEDSIKTLTAYKMLSMEAVEESLPRTPTFSERHRRLSFDNQTAQRLDFISMREEVQALIRDILADNPQEYQNWLLSATSLFCLAFRSAAGQVLNSPELRISKRDLKLFKTHGNTLRSHYGSTEHDGDHREAFDALTNLDITLALIEQAGKDLETGSTANAPNSPSVFSDVFHDFNFEAAVEAKEKRVKHGRTIFSIPDRYMKAAWTKYSPSNPEPPLKPGMRRLRWKCVRTCVPPSRDFANLNQVCGEDLFDDYFEIEPGSLHRLEKLLRQHNNGQASQVGIFGSITHSFTRPFQSLVWLSQQTFRRSKQEGLPSALPTYVARPARGPPSPARADAMYLLMCINHKIPGSKLHHQPILRDQVQADRELFSSLRQTYFERRRYLGSLLSVRNVKRLDLVKFVVDLSGVVDTNSHSHNTSCGTSPNECTCTPPPELILPSPTAEYTLKYPPKYVPAVGSNYLTHCFQHPECIKKEEKWVYNQIPKRIGSRLESTPENSPLLGWGIGFEEGWDEAKLKHGGFLIFVVGSFIFAILWSVLKHDIQSAFGISAYWMTGLAIITGYAATYPN
jgi:hypothetical protein